MTIAFGDGGAAGAASAAGGVAGGGEAVEADESGATAGAGRAESAGEAEAREPSGKGTGRRMGMGASRAGADVVTGVGDDDAGVGSSAQSGQAAKAQTKNANDMSHRRKTCFLSESEKEKWIIRIGRISWGVAR